jgi:hypothetical protein
MTGPKALRTRSGCTLTLNDEDLEAPAVTTSGSDRSDWLPYVRRSKSGLRDEGLGLQQQARRDSNPQPSDP